MYERERVREISGDFDAESDAKPIPASAARHTVLDEEDPKKRG